MRRFSRRGMQALCDALEPRRLLSATVADLSPLAPLRDAQWASIGATLLPSADRAAAQHLPFADLGPLVEHAASAQLADLAPLAQLTGTAAQTLADHGIRAAWWMGQSINTQAGEWLLQVDGLAGTPQAQTAALESWLSPGRATAASGPRLDNPGPFGEQPLSTTPFSVKYMGLDGMFLIRAPESMGYAALLQSFSQVPGFNYLEPNMVIGRPADAEPALLPNDPSWGSLWGLTKINAPGAWDITTGSKDIIVAVLDTGAQITHPDLAANIWVNPGETPGNGIDDDGNGYIDDVYGWDFYGNDAQSTYNSHGTHVAGTIGAVGNNGIGVAGVSWNVTVLNADIFNDSTNTTSSTYYIAAMNYLADLKRRGQNIVASNNSYGSLSNSSTSVINAVNNQAAHNIMFVAAAGNDGQDVTTSGFNPATNGTPNTIAVAASTTTDSRASFSNWSSTRVHIAAPGTSIYSTTPTNSYANMQGTSMASPHVAGLVGLTYSVVPDASYHQVRQAIFDGGDPVTWTSTPTITNKRINAGNTIDIVRTNVSGTLWHDGDADQTQDAHESVLSGWIVYADANNSSTFDTGEQYATVQFNGRYTLILPPGSHTLRLQNQSGWTQTLGAAGYAVNLTQFQALDDHDFGVHQTGAQIAGTVYGDADQSANRNAGDIDLAEIPVFIDINNNGTREATPTTVASNSSSTTITSHSTQTRTVTSNLAVSGVGNVIDVNVTVNITHADVNKLTLTLIDPGGSRVQLTSGTLTGANFSGTTFDDEAAAGIESASAPFTGTFRPYRSLSAFDGRAGSGTWKLEVTNQPAGGTGTLTSWSLNIIHDQAEPLTYSNTDGSYRFTGLAPAAYTIRPVIPLGWTQTAPAAGAPHTASPTTGQVITGLDFGLIGPGGIIPGTIRGHVLNDLNANGQPDAAEPYLAGLTVFVDTDNSGTLDAGEISTLSDSTGLYVLSNVPAGTHTVRLIVPPGWNTSNPSPALHSITLSAGQIADDNNFAIFQRIIRGSVFEDLNANGLRDGSDPNLSGWTVYADLDASGSLNAGDISAVTNSLGAYELAGLPAAPVNVRIVMQANWFQSAPVGGAHLGVNPTSPPIVENINFANYRRATIGGTVFDDLNYNAAVNTGEPRLAGITVYLDANNNSQLDAGETTVLTNSSGVYTFSGLTPGAYIVRHQMPAGYGAVSPVTGVYNLTVTSNQSTTSNHFANAQIANFRLPDLYGSAALGLDQRYYEFDGNIEGSTVNSLDAMTPVSTGVSSNFTLSTARADSFGHIWTGYVLAPADAVYTFYTTSDDGSTLSIGGTLIVNNDGAHGSQERSGRIGLKAGLHPITVKYFENTSSQVLTVSYQSPTLSKAAIPNSALYRAMPPVAGTASAEAYTLTRDGDDLRIYKGDILPANLVARVPLHYAGPVALNTLAGDDTITLDFSNGSPIPAGGLNIDGGDHTGADKLTIRGTPGPDTVSINPSSATVNAATFTFTNIEQVIFDPNSGATALTANANVTLDSSQTFSSLTIAAGAAVTVLPGMDKTLTIGTLAIAPTAQLDLTDNHLSVTGMTAADVRALLLTGFNSGDWAGNGLTSSAARNDPTYYTALGYASNADLSYTTFAGQPVSGTDILVKYTYYGDSDLNGIVDADDLTNWIDGFNSVGSPLWLYGDFDYSGVVDADDLTLWVDGFLNPAGPLSSPLLRQPAAASVSPTTAKPAGLFSDTRIGDEEDDGLSGLLA